MPKQRHIGFTIFAVCGALAARLAIFEPAPPHELTPAEERWGAHETNNDSLGIIHSLRYYIYGLGVLGLLIVAEDYLNEEWQKKKASTGPATKPGNLKTALKIMDGGLDNPQVQRLLAHHLEAARAETSPGHAHALDLGGLKSPDIRFWSAWDGEQVIAVGALKLLSPSHGEVKSMHTEQARRRQGAGGMMLRHIIVQARELGVSRLSLETGSRPYFQPARELYRRHGFKECPPFGDYVVDSNSVFMTLEFSSPPDQA